MPSRLVSTSASPGLAPALYTISDGLATPVTASPYLGSLSSIEWPPAISAPDSATLSRPPRSTSASTSAPSSGGHATRFIAVSGRRAHGVDVRQRVRGGDGAERIRVVDDRREEVDRLHEAEVVGHLRDGGVVSRLEETRELAAGGGKLVEDGLQVTRTHLGRSTALRRVLRHADLVGHAASLPQADARAGMVSSRHGGRSAWAARATEKPRTTRPAAAGPRGPAAPASPAPRRRARRPRRPRRPLRPDAALVRGLWLRPAERERVRRGRRRGRRRSRRAAVAHPHRRSVPHAGDEGRRRHQGRELPRRPAPRLLRPRRAAPPRPPLVRAHRQRLDLGQVPQGPAVGVGRHGLDRTAGRRARRRSHLHRLRRV